MFPTSWEHEKKPDLQKIYKSIENYQANLVLGASFMMEKIPHTKAKLV